MAWNLLDPTLPERLKHCAAPVLRALALQVCQAAIAQVELKNDDIEVAIAALRAQRYDDRHLKDKVEALVAALDERQWDLQDRVDQGIAAKADQIQAFRVARAANAVSAALTADPQEAIEGAIYEANFAIGDWHAIETIINQYLARDTAT